MQGWLCVLAVVCSVAALDDPRDARWFLGGGGVITTSVINKRVVTEMVPSSCVVVAPSLSPCREMRELTIYPSPTESITPTTSASFVSDEDREGRFWGSEWAQAFSVAPSQYQNDEGALKATPPPSKSAPSSEKPGGWSFNDLFNGGYTTVTQTVLLEETQKVLDTAHVITFSVVGCMPTRLPFNLAACEEGVLPSLTHYAHIAAVVDPRDSGNSR